MPDNAAEVTAAGIARLAGVGRAAVSNWRRRHADFPKPVGGTETSPTFALGDIERWLRAQGKLAEVPLRERVWQLLTGHPAGGAAALCQVGAVLLLVRDRPAVWQRLSEGADEQLAEMLPVALAPALTARLGETHPVCLPDPAGLGPTVPLLRGAAELAAELGPREAYEFLLGRHLDANPRQYTLTPPGPAALMAALAGLTPGQGAAVAPGGKGASGGRGAPDAPAAGAGTAGSVLDPASGTGGLLGAAGAAASVYAQERDPDLAALTALRLALGTDARARVAGGDSLRADAFPGTAVDAVVCHPPFNERNWGHDELAYDPRWEYGFPARTESELAWVQHALAHLRDGGTAVLLMPPAAASRRSGRRIRADLLRRGALRAVVALPAGAAPPYGIPLHLWVLRRPGAGQPPAPHVLLVDAAAAVAAPAEGPTAPGAATLGPAAQGAAAPSSGRGKLPWQTVRTTVLDAWHAFDREGAAPERPGVCRVLPVIELLDDDVDLAPARHLPPPATGGGIAELAAVRDRLTATLTRTAELTPAAPVRPRAEQTAADRRPMTTVGELARAGALVLKSGTTAAGGSFPVLTEQDVLAATGPSGPAGEGAEGEEPVLTEPGDVVVPLIGGGTVARVVDESTAGAALGRNLSLLRPDPDALDPWFLAGYLRGSANQRQASSYASTATRLDVRRLRLPRLPLADQRRYGERYRTLASFEESLRHAARLGEQLVRGLYDGLADGTVEPH
ncbi:N-6 DNA methylase [Streptomyces sp. S465]|uniref:N-6 DNA methylase n=1 Tax=Streptomyces sp. S465 TaxID=2979468 RepID=UPI0022A8A4D9|nr:N-6 DNA methylase [Streptomyces sp. S465]WAP56502.1 N-6 DNA methylase [Streptomyces sp. S465]